MIVISVGFNINCTFSKPHSDGLQSLSADTTNVISNYLSIICYFAYRVRASQDQMKALVNYATFRFRPWWCPGAVGSPCLVNSQCNPPGICSWFRCVLCNQDTQCAANQYCKGRFNPFIVNHCSARKPNSQLCTRDAMCISGKRKLTEPNIFDQGISS